MRILAVVFTILMSYSTFAAKAPVGCSSLLVGGENLRVAPFVHEMLDFYSHMRDLPKFNDISLYPEGRNPEATAQYEELKKVFRGEEATLDPESREFRRRMSTDPLEKKWKPEHGTIEREAIELNNRMLLFGRVIAEKDGVLLVALPLPELLWDEADMSKMDFYFVMQVEASGTPNEFLQKARLGMDEFDQKAGAMNLQFYFKAVGPNAKAIRSEVVTLPLADPTRLYLAEEVIRFFRTDALQSRGLSHLLSVFKTEQ